MAKSIENLKNAFDEMFDFITDLPSGLVGFESDFDSAFEELRELKATLPPPNEWVSVEERLPEEKEMCLLYTPRDGIMCVGFYAGNDNWEHKHKWKLVTAMRSSQTLTKKVTHWMPIPEPPDRRSPEGKT